MILYQNIYSLISPLIISKVSLSISMLLSFWWRIQIFQNYNYCWKTQILLVLLVLLIFEKISTRYSNWNNYNLSVYLSSKNECSMLKVKLSTQTRQASFQAVQQNLLCVYFLFVTPHIEVYSRAEIKLIIYITSSSRTCSF